MPCPRNKKGKPCHLQEKNDDEPAKTATTKESVTPSKVLNTLVFRYIPMSRRKNGQFPFKTGTSKVNTQLHKDNVKLLKTNAVLPLTQIGDAKVSKPPGFIKPYQRGQNQALF